MFRIVGKIIDNEKNKNIVGYRLCDDRTGAIGSYTLQEAFKALSLDTVGIRPTANEQDRAKSCEFPDPYVVYTDGAESKLPVFTANGVCIRNSGKIVVLSMFVRNNITYYNVVKNGKPITMTKDEVLAEYRVSTNTGDGQTPFYNITIDADKGIIKSRNADETIPDVTKNMNKSLGSAISVSVPKTNIKEGTEDGEYEAPKNFEEVETFETIEKPKVTKPVHIDDEYSIKNPVIDVHYVGLVQNIVDSMRLSRRKYLGDCSYWKRYTNEQFDAMAAFLQMFPFTTNTIEKPYNMDGADFYSKKASKTIYEFEREPYGYEFEHKDYIDYAKIAFLRRLFSKLYIIDTEYHGVRVRPCLEWFCKHYASRDTSTELNVTFRNFGIFVREVVMLMMPELMPNIVAMLTCTNKTLTITDKIQGSILYIMSYMANRIAVEGNEKLRIKAGTKFGGFSYYAYSPYNSLRWYRDVRDFKRDLSNYKFKPILFDERLKAADYNYGLCYVAMCAGVDISNAGLPENTMDFVKTCLKNGNLFPMTKSESVFMSIYNKYNPVDPQTPYSEYERFTKNVSFYEFMGLTLDNSITYKPWEIESYKYVKYNRDLKTSFPSVISNNENLVELTMQYIKGQHLSYLNYWHLRRILAYIFNFDATNHTIDDYKTFYEKFYKYAHKYGLRRISDASYCVLAVTTLREKAGMLLPDGKTQLFDAWNMWDYIYNKGDYEYLDDIATFATAFSIYMGKFKELDIYLTAIKAYVSKKYKDRIDCVISMLNTQFKNMTFKTEELNSCVANIMQDEDIFAADYNKHMLLMFHKRSYNRFYGFPKVTGRLRKFKYADEFNIPQQDRNVRNRSEFMSLNPSIYSSSEEKSNEPEEKRLSSISLTPLIQLVLKEQAAIMGY